MGGGTPMPSHVVSPSFCHLITGCPDSGGLGPWRQTAASLSLFGLQGPHKVVTRLPPQIPPLRPSQAGLASASRAGGHSGSNTPVTSQEALGRCFWSLSLAAWAWFQNLLEPPSWVMHL